MTQPKTLDEIRDWFARRRGWHPSEGHWDHSVPATLDAIAGLMPSGWDWGRGLDVPVEGVSRFRWLAWNGGKVVETPVTGTDLAAEIRDRATLAYLAQIEQDKHKEKA